MNNSSTIDTAIFDVITLIPSNPAAGANLNFPVPTNRRIMLIAIRFTLATDANVGNRNVQLVFHDGTTPVIEIPNTTIQPASQTRIYDFLLNGGAVYTSAGGGRFINALPLNNWLDDNASIRTAITSLQVTDQISAIFIRALSQIME